MTNKSKKVMHKLKGEHEFIPYDWNEDEWTEPQYGICKVCNFTQSMDKYYYSDSKFYKKPKESTTINVGGTGGSGGASYGGGGAGSTFVATLNPIVYSSNIGTYSNFRATT